MEVGDVGISEPRDVMEALRWLRDEEGLTPGEAVENLRGVLNVYGDRASGIVAYALLDMCKALACRVSEPVFDAMVRLVEERIG